MKYPHMIFSTLCALMLMSSLPLASSPSDDRVAISLNQTERAIILHEMRQFLAGMQTMLGALAEEDMPLVAHTARSLGTQMTHEVPPSLKQKLPEPFRKMGFAVHSDFDTLALDAESLEDSKHALNQLSLTVKKCVACHSAYEISIPSDSDLSENNR